MAKGFPVLAVGTDAAAMSSTCVAGGSTSVWGCRGLSWMALQLNSLRLGPMFVA
jgi:hypothetical protein